VEAALADEASFYRSLIRSMPSSAHFFTNSPVDCDIDPDAPSIRCSLMRRKHPHKIDLLRLLAYPTFQFAQFWTYIIAPRLTWERVAVPLPKF